jgi:hypothetical protein
MGGTGKGKDAADKAKQSGKRGADSLNDEAGSDDDLFESPLAKERATPEALLRKQQAKDNIEDVRADMKEELHSLKASADLTARRMRQDQEAESQGNKWHKGLNQQIYIHEDTLISLKAAERKLSAVMIVQPSDESINALLESKPISLEGFEPIGLKALKGVNEALKEIGTAQEILSKRILQLGVVRSAGSAKQGYRALEIMANYTVVDNGSDKALKEASKQIEEEEKEALKKKNKNPYQGNKSWVAEPKPRGGWGAARAEPSSRTRDDFSRAWDEDQRYSNSSQADPPRGGSQSMPYGSQSRGKGGGKGNQGSCNSCGEFGHWAATCDRYSRRSGGW